MSDIKIDPDHKYWSVTDPETYYYVDQADKGLFRIMTVTGNGQAHETWSNWFTEEKSAHKIAELLATNQL